MYRAYSSAQNSVLYKSREIEIMNPAQHGYRRTKGRPVASVDVCVVALKKSMLTMSSRLDHVISTALYVDAGA